MVIILLIAAVVSGAVNTISTTNENSEEVKLSATTLVQIQEKIGCDVIDQQGTSTVSQYCLGLPTQQICDTNFVETYDLSQECSPLHQEHESEGYTEALLIFAIVIAIAITGFLNEYRAEKTVEALRKLVSQNTKVLREGKVIEIPSSQLVPGDIVLLEEGQKIPADVRLIEAKSLLINEASLTGESEAVKKTTDAIEEDSALGDQKNMVFSGTFVSSGVGTGVVVATGSSTEIGKIAKLVNEVETEETPMQKKLDALGKQLGIGVIAICAIVFVVIFFFDKEAIDASLVARLIFAFTAAVALAVAAIPEGLAFVVRISLALGARRMAGKNALVRKLSAVEALGSTDTICSDKTGTLTKGEMTVRKLWYDDSYYEVSGTGYGVKGSFSQNGAEVKASELDSLLRIGALCNNSQLKNEHDIIGDPTEAALLASAGKAGIEKEKINKLAKRIEEVPFSSDRKRMSTVHKVKSGYFVATKGAAEAVLDACSHIYLNGKKVKLTAAHKKHIMEANTELASQALRVLGFAYKQSRKPLHKDQEIESDLVFVGLQGMMDPPRVEVTEVIKRVTSEAGMDVIMITGDHAETASAVAAEIGIHGDTVTGLELDKMSQEEFEKRVEKIRVYARVNPEHKIRIVQALKSHGHQVAMTGDGVNDAPAIKAADIGIAMGITGTDAAKEASDMILLDDQFLTIINAIEEGRGIFDNVRKFVNYLLSANIAEVISILFGVLIFQDLLLTAAQLLFINIVTDGLPAVALGSDPAEKGIMRFKPWRFQGSILNKRVWTEMFLFGSMMSIALLIHFGFVFDGPQSDALAKSVAFIGMVVYEMVRLIDIRTDYNIRWFSNPWLSVAIAGSFALLAAVVYVQPLADLFGLVPVGAVHWIAIGIVSVVLFAAMKIANPILDRIMPDVPSS
ncbi:TPA: cation-translocating P-type ATPase [Candidatus Saccharibacteria bacterium]|nr:cation-translocating P-type ATPase [Candidatus Saccharibacteria bacterium]HIO87926.1 cation-translocating P-type ATPase [Candidatus Saccharibacteria bacterium]